MDCIRTCNSRAWTRKACSNHGCETPSHTHANNPAHALGLMEDIKAATLHGPSTTGNRPSRNLVVCKICSRARSLRCMTLALVQNAPSTLCLSWFATVLPVKSLQGAASRGRWIHVAMLASTRCRMPSAALRSSCRVPCTHTSKAEDQFHASQSCATDELRPHLGTCASSSRALIEHALDDRGSALSLTNKPSLTR